MSTDRTDRSPKSAPRSLAQRGGRVARYALIFITTVLVIDAVVGEKGLLALLKARRNFEAVEASLAEARAVSVKIPRPSKKSPAANSG